MAITPFTVEGTRVNLVPVSPEHAGQLHVILDSSDEYSRWTSIPWPYTEEMAEQWTGGAAGRWEAGSPDWALVEVATGAMVGVISLFAGVRNPGSFEIGYWLDKDRWGEGLMSEAVRLSVEAAFEHLGATRVEWLADVGNWGSWKPVWRCGFRREGVQRRAGRRLWVAGLLADDPREPACPWDGPGPTAAHGQALDPSRPGALVAQFHSTYSMPNRLAAHQEPTLDIERLGMRMSLIGEEFAELVGAVHGARACALVEEAVAQASAADDGARDVVEAADALADMIYVIYGMALECGIDLDAVLAEVQASNLSKLMPDGTVKLREDGKVLKGPNFFPPDVRRALGLV
ncbi:GNAT family N-acetyltransferase [Schaalia sp. 19OD2882]|uniref:GNAT family N-acetyltransferase n=1 Tax=Schaalia sp. 19OD2882 TaxID=2794089 RepID=UPI001C1EE575|nr:GNAT family N-acetyltransferase [Schaalia sp. 19OD2882]QWW18732.1 GNAT family N-acetyltransferase [Schaalia sp. 19OD2882]